MKSLKQRKNERPIISPFGFTGVIVKNSNAVIDKSFIKKGTSFVNAYENSNVVLKDCGSPIPTVKSSSDMNTRLQQKLKFETETIDLPPWVYYKVSRFDNKVDTTSNKPYRAPLTPCPPAFFVKFCDESKAEVRISIQENR